MPDYSFESIRRECIDHLVVLGEAHLRRILTKYAVYYNGLIGLSTRTPRSIAPSSTWATLYLRPSSADFITVWRPHGRVQRGGQTRRV